MNSGEPCSLKKPIRQSRRYRPSHVPESLIRSLDTYNDPRMEVDPFGAMLENAAGTAVYWDDVDAGFRKGCWVITRMKDIRFVLGNPDLFRPNNWVKRASAGRGDVEAHSQHT